jgi:hypothetical protein
MSLTLDSNFGLISAVLKWVFNLYLLEYRVVTCMKPKWEMQIGWLVGNVEDYFA